MEQAAKAGAPGDLRVGVVGVGVMGSNHARVIVGLPGAQLVGVADPDRQQAAFVASALGTKAVDDLDALIKLGVDAVTIAAPTHFHHDLALTCIKRGIHVLVEKPIASNVEEGRSIVAAAKRAGVTLMVGHVERFNPAVETIKEAIRGERILSIAITRVGPFPPRMSNVGVVIDLAVHDIDLIRWFTDSEIVEVQPQLANAIAEREDIALLQFRTASGVLAQINTNWLTPFKARTVHVATRDKPFGRLLGAAALGTPRLPHRHPPALGPGGDGGGGRGEPRDRHALPQGPAERAGHAAARGGAACGRLRRLFPRGMDSRM
jgi:predicted dehydrogenase